MHSYHNFRCYSGPSDSLLLILLIPGVIEKLDIPLGDEDDINSALLPLLYQCRGGEFIWEIYHCDGIEHCHDGDDEFNCK